jgi:hypothetical protein
MPKYYVNDNAQPTGEHEVHMEGCVWLAKVKSATYLGVYGDCHVAVKEARKKYVDVDGCATCCSACNTK